MTGSGGSRPRLHALTGLRFVAAMAVFADHAFPSQVGNWLGDCGVAFFFVLSGFVLTWSRPPGDSVRAFYRRRFARIYPLHVLTLALGVAVLGSGLLPWPVAPSPGVIVANLLLVQAWRGAPLGWYSPNPPAWSLSYEAAFYALLPFVLPRVRRARTLIVGGLVAPFVMAAAVAMLSLVITGHLVWQSHAMFFVLHIPLVAVGMFLAGAGGALAVQQGERAPRWLAPVAVLLLLPLFMRGTPDESWVMAVTAPVFLAVILGVASAELSGRHSWLARPVMVRLGEWSFAFYLIHYLVITPALRYVEIGSRTQWLVSAVALPVSLLLAWVMHRYVEIPFEAMLRGRGSGRAVAPLRLPGSARDESRLAR